MNAPAAALQSALKSLNPLDENCAVAAVDLLLAHASATGATDIHLQPVETGLEVRRRIDGVLELVGELPKSVAPRVVARLKVLAGLLTYKTDIPQEGRIRFAKGEMETRVSTFPTLHGERAVLRHFPAAGGLHRPRDLGLPEGIVSTLEGLLDETSGAIVLSGPAGGGKTTSIYACLREIVARTEGKRSLLTIEDPIEAAVKGVSQSQVNLQAGFDLAEGLRALLRQDPEVIVVGEMRDRTTAELTIQASLTGHLVITTFHAGTASGVITRLLEMGIEPYLLKSGLLAVLSQRLLRRLCPCAREIDPSLPARNLGLPVERACEPVGCEKCGGLGFSGRFPIAEILTSRNLQAGERSARVDPGETLWDRAIEAVDQGKTSCAEVRRVLGFSEAAGAD